MLILLWELDSLFRNKIKCNVHEVTIVGMSVVASEQVMRSGAGVLQCFGAIEADVLQCFSAIGWFCLWLKVIDFVSVEWWVVTHLTNEAAQSVLSLVALVFVSALLLDGFVESIGAVSDRRVVVQCLVCVCEMMCVVCVYVWVGDDKWCCVIWGCGRESAVVYGEVRELSFPYLVL